MTVVAPAAGTAAAPGAAVSSRGKYKPKMVMARGKEPDFWNKNKQAPPVTPRKLKHGEFTVGPDKDDIAWANAMDQESNRRMEEIRLANRAKRKAKWGFEF